MSSKDLDFLYEVAKRISVRSKQNSPISQEEIFDLFKETFERMMDVRMVEAPIFMPIVVEKEDDWFVARCPVYRVCKGVGRNEEEAIEKLKGEIELYNKTCLDAEKKMRIEEMVKKIFLWEFF